MKVRSRVTFFFFFFLFFLLPPFLAILSFFPMGVQLLQHYCGKGNFCQKSVGRMYVGLFLGLLFHYCSYVVELNMG